MPFIGQQPITGAYSKLDSITTSATATYNLQLNGGAYYPQSANHLLVSLNGVMQAPQDSFTDSGSQITFASALTSSDSIDFIMALGDVLDIGTPSDGSVNTSQLANSAVTDAKIASGITASKLTGALPAIDGSALTGISQDFVRLADVDSTSSVSSVDISLDYSDYKSFQLNMYILGSSTSSTENFDIVYKRDGQSSFDTGTNYGTQNVLVDSGAVRNENGTNTSVELFTTNNPSDGWTSTIFFNGFGESDRPSDFHFFTSKSGPSLATWVGGGGYNTDVLKIQRVIDIRLSFTAGNITEIRYQLYGLK